MKRKSVSFLKIEHSSKQITTNTAEYVTYLRSRILIQVPGEVISVALALIAQRICCPNSANIQVAIITRDHSQGESLASRYCEIFPVPDVSLRKQFWVLIS
ncbi:hypothetical protein AVEN_62055-1 [Araneus ventricosus]|uniref:Uncharacterized protein n=1 Tax=Araneus ventricosus TaxID=182803 RepID=A0A4Y2I1A6_ARAVE|nr:hypothetical protein AVEN_62055-1 [Araneus ventricosus]